MNNVIKELQQQLTDAGFKSAVVSIQHLPALQHDLEHLLTQGLLRRDFYESLISRYGLKFQFEPPADFPTAQSAIITAVPQPKFSVTFKASGKRYSAIIPPTYIHDTDKTISMIISQCLRPHGYSIHNALLPAKLLAVRSGLAAYGKNNIAYIDGWGSFFRLKVFFSDLPCPSDPWQDLKMMDRCHTCETCFKRCPTNAIRDDRFLLDGNRCITYHNEAEDEFPEWIDPAWHNCLVGCMICQDNCPANKTFKNRIVAIEEFSEAETLMFLKDGSRQNLSDEIIHKLQAFGMADDYLSFQRNLRVLIAQTDGRLAHESLAHESHE